MTILVLLWQHSHTHTHAHTSILQQHFTHSFSRHNPLTASSVGAAPHQMARCAPPAGRNQQGAERFEAQRRRDPSTPRGSSRSALRQSVFSRGGELLFFFFFSILLRRRRTSEEPQTVKRVQSTECLGLTGSRSPRHDASHSIRRFVSKSCVRAEDVMLLLGGDRTQFQGPDQ